MGFPINTGIDKSASDAPQSVVDEGRRPIADGVAVVIAVVGGCGFVPLAPGTAGSFVAALGFGIVFWSGLSAAVERAAVSGVVGLCVAIVVLFALGVWASGRAEEKFGKHDDGRIVIDEVVGQLITLLPVAILAPRLLFDAGLFSFISWVVTGFVLFRVFDVWKPGAIRWTERRLTGGLGVMADDVVAGIYGAAVLTLFMLLPEQLGSDLSSSVFAGEVVS